MSKKVLVISTSLRNNSNSDFLAESFINGAKDAGNEVEKISLIGKKIEFCKGCLACQSLGKCVINDDMIEIAEKMKGAEVIAFATPIYYYEMSGQMKTLLDRANSLFGSDYKFKDIYMLSTAADNDDSTDEKALSGLEGWVNCFSRANIKGKVFAGGVTAPAEIKNHKALETAFALGKNV